MASRKDRFNPSLGPPVWPACHDGRACFLACSGFHRCRGTCHAWAGCKRLGEALQKAEAEPDLLRGVAGSTQISSARLI